jgi:hypothetical protein
MQLAVAAKPAVKRRRAGAERDRVLRAHASGEGFLELAHLRRGGHPVGAQHLDHGLDVVFLNELPSVQKQRLSDGSSPVDRQHFLTCGRGAHGVFPATPEPETWRARPRSGLEVVRS